MELNVLYENKIGAKYLGLALSKLTKIVILNIILKLSIIIIIL